MFHKSLSRIESRMTKYKAVPTLSIARPGGDYSFGKESCYREDHLFCRGDPFKVRSVCFSTGSFGTSNFALAR
jgi:hypothetical protein